jgi:hypothetical protein
MAGRAYLVVEGHGETQAALALVTRLWKNLGLPPMYWDDRVIRGRALHTRAGVDQAIELVRRKRDVRALLILRDEDDSCPKETGPLAAGWVARARLAFPAAVVLLRREYETLFLPSLWRMAGKPLVDPRGVQRPGIREGAHYDGDPEAPRDAKGEISRRFARGAYKPTIDQLALTRMIDFEDLRAVGLPAFGTLERALRFLAQEACAGAVYPPPALQRGA